LTDSIGATRLHAYIAVSAEGGTPVRRTASFVAAATVLVTALSVAPADAAFPGRNGRIAFYMDRGSGAEIYSMRHDGTDVLRLTHLDVSVERPQWSPDGTKIVFQMDRQAGGCDIEVMDSDGSNLLDITPDRVPGARLRGGTSFTPNGHRIVFSAEACARCIEDIRSVRLDGTGLRQVVGARRLYKFYPKVSPKGGTVAFLVEGARGNAIYTARMNGTHLRRIVPYSVDPGGLSWAPHGGRIVFSDHANTPTKPGNLDTVRPDGSGFRQVTDFNGVDLRAGCSCSFSPDGKWIVYRRFNEKAGRYAVWKMHPDGTHQTRVLRTKQPAMGNDWGPRPT
jgi:Tol biopolymer transport system component